MIIILHLKYVQKTLFYHFHKNNAYTVVFIDMCIFNKQKQLYEWKESRYLLSQYALKKFQIFYYSPMYVFITFYWKTTYLKMYFFVIIITKFKRDCQSNQNLLLVKTNIIFYVIFLLKNICTLPQIFISLQVIFVAIHICVF